MPVPEVAAAVELRSVRKVFGQVVALDSIDLAIQPGEVVAMLGPNGAGKTTAISVMLGLRQPTEGIARIFGQRPDSEAARVRCGVMLQESGVPMVLKVREMVDLFRSYYPAPLPTAEVLDLVDLAPSAHIASGDLSGGQRQRLYLALALCGDPELLFLDEPTVGMDVQARQAFLRTIGEYVDRGRTLVLTTHYLEEADQLARRIVVIDKGRVIADDSPQSIKSRVPGRRVRFRGRVDAADWRDLPALNVEEAGGEVRFLSNEPEAVLRELFRRGAEITDLEVTGAGLEEAFLTLTAREANA